MSNILRVFGLTVSLTLYVNADVLCVKKIATVAKRNQLSLASSIKVSGTKCPTGFQAILDTSKFKGEQGQTGTQGLKGDQGEQGVSGLQGLKGDKGDTGLQGVKGEAGEQGVSGLQGLKGDKGDTGLQGVKGEAGEQGIKGDKGDTGATGSQGTPAVSYDTCRKVENTVSVVFDPINNNECLDNASFQYTCATNEYLFDHRIYRTRRWSEDYQISNQTPESLEVFSYSVIDKYTTVLDQQFIEDGITAGDPNTISTLEGIVYDSQGILPIGIKREYHLEPNTNSQCGYNDYIVTQGTANLNRKIVMTCCQIGGSN